MPSSKRYNVVRKEVKGDKTKWIRVGVVFMDDEKDGGKLHLDLFADGFYLFPPKEKEGEASW